MRFSAFSLFALSSLFVGAFAAPTSIESREAAIAEVAQRDVAVAAPVEEREVSAIITIVEGLYTEVFSFTKSINVTIDSCTGQITVTKKFTVIAGIQVVIGKIIASFSNACIKIWQLPKIELPTVDFKLLIELVIKIFLECVFTFLAAAKKLECSIIELLGSTLALFLHAYISFLVAIGKIAIGFVAEIKIAFGAHLIIIGKCFVDFGYLLSCL